MSLVMWGAVLGTVVGLGLVLVLTRARLVGRPQLAVRVLPYVRDLPQEGRTPAVKATIARVSSVRFTKRLLKWRTPRGLVPQLSALQ